MDRLIKVFHTHSSKEVPEWSWSCPTTTVTRRLLVLYVMVPVLIRPPLVVLMCKGWCSHSSGSLSWTVVPLSLKLATTPESIGAGRTEKAPKNQDGGAVLNTVTS